jgi:hypothetical protein
MKYIILLLSMMLFNSCKSSNEIELESDKFLKIKYKKSINFNDSDIKIELLEVLEDSRCPEDVICFWAGNANVLIKFADSTFSINSTISPKSFKYKDYNIVLVNLSPYPHSKKIINKKDYIVSLDIQENKK